MRRSLLLLMLLFPFGMSAQTSDVEGLFNKMRERLSSVKDYVADVKIRIDVSFMKVPQLNGKIYFKAPDKIKLERNGGISILPKSNLSLTLNSLVPAGGVTVIDAGYDTIGNQKVHVIKVVPNGETSDIVLTKIWIDETNLLALRTETTTRDNGTIKMELSFGKYASFALPDKVVFYIDIKDYKMPKGMMMDYEGGTQQEMVQPSADGKRRKGRISINYLSYTLNIGLTDDIFKEKKK